MEQPQEAPECSQPQYRVRPLEPGEIITDVGDHVVIGGRIRTLAPSDVALAIHRDGQIAAVISGGKLIYSHADKGLVREDCIDVASGVRRMRDLIGDIR